MKSRLSGLMDGELAEHDAQELFAGLRQDEALRSRWLEYQLIGDTLKGEKDLHVEFTGRVMAALEAEPTVLAPRTPARRQLWHRHALALAATLAGVAVVGWLALGTAQSPDPAAVAQAPAQSANIAVATAKNAASVVPVAIAQREAAPDMQQYLVAHEAQSSLLQFRGGAEHIRTVAAVGSAPSK